MPAAPHRCASARSRFRSTRRTSTGSSTATSPSTRPRPRRPRAASSHELVNGGDTPAWDALTSQLVEEKAGSFRKPAFWASRRAYRQAAKRPHGVLPLRCLRGLGRRRGPRCRGRALRRQPLRRTDLDPGRHVDRRRHRRPGRSARARPPACRRLGRELRPEGRRRRRDRAADRGATGWLTPQRSFSPPATRRPRSLQRWRRSDSSFPARR